METKPRIQESTQGGWGSRNLSLALCQQRPPLFGHVATPQDQPQSLPKLRCTDLVLDRAPMEREKGASPGQRKERPAEVSCLSEGRVVGLRILEGRAVVAPAWSGKRLRDYPCPWGLKQRSYAPRPAGSSLGFKAGHFTRKVRFSGSCEIDFIFAP